MPAIVKQNYFSASIVNLHYVVPFLLLIHKQRLKFLLTPNRLKFHF